MTRMIPLAKLLCLLSLIALISCMFVVRHGAASVLATRATAVDRLASFSHEQELARFDERRDEYESRMAAYELQLARQRQLLELSKTDPDEFLNRVTQAQPYQASLPYRPYPPIGPELRQELIAINAAFERERAAFFDSLGPVAAVGWIATILFVCTLAYCALFEQGVGRFASLAVLVVGLVFLIGPAMYMINISAVSRMQPPPTEQAPSRWGY